MTVPLDDAFQALANSERRRLLLALKDHNPQPDNLFEYPDDVPLQSRENNENLHVRMRHNHLPMLESAGFIEWHQDDREISKGPKFGVIRPLLEVIDLKTELDGATDGL